MSAYVIEAYGMNDKVLDIHSGLEYVNDDRMNVVLVRNYHDFIAGSDANQNRLSSGFSFPFESRVDDFNSVDRFPVCMLWNKFISTKDSSRVKLNVNHRDLDTNKNFDVNVDELLVAYVQSLVKEFKQKHGIVSDKNQKDHYILPIPNELTEYSQEYLIRSLSTKNVEITLIWREVAALMKFIQESKDKISFKEGQKIKVVYLGEDALESAILELRLLKNEFVPVRARPKLQKRIYSGFDYLSQSLKQSFSSQKECSNKTLWEIFNTRTDYVQSALGKPYQEESLPVELDAISSHKTIIKSIVLNPNVDIKFSQSDLLNQVVQIKSEQSEAISFCDFVLGQSDENYDAILLCGDIATDVISHKIQENLSYINKPIWASDTDLIVEGAKLYQENLENDKPTYLDCLPKLEIAYRDNVNPDWKWISLVKEGELVEGGKKYKSEEPFSKLGISKGSNTLPIYLRVESLDDNDDGVRIDKRLFEKVAPKDLRLYITVSMKAAFGLAKLRIKDELNFYSDNGFIFDYSKMKKGPLPNIKLELAYPLELSIKVLPAIKENPKLKEISQFLEKYVNWYHRFRLNEPNIETVFKELSKSLYIDNHYYGHFDINLNAGNEKNKVYLNNIIKLMYENSIELSDKKNKLLDYSSLTKFKVFYKEAPEKLKKICIEQLSSQKNYINLRQFFGTCCKTLYDNAENIKLIYQYFNRLPPKDRAKIYIPESLIWLLNYVSEAKKYLDRTTADNIVQASYDMFMEQLEQNNFRQKFYTATVLLLVALKYRVNDPDFLTPQDTNKDNLMRLEIIYSAIDMGIKALSNSKDKKRYYGKVVHMHDEVKRFIEKKGNQNFLVTISNINDEDAN